MSARLPSGLISAIATVAATLSLSACDQAQDAGHRGTRERADTAAARKAAAPPVSVNAPDGLRVDEATRDELAHAARRFATTLAAWLYGDRRRTKVAPISADVRHELAVSPPYVPVDQRGSGEGEVVRVEVFLQTLRSGVISVELADSRTRYAIPAGFERRRGVWRVVHLNTH